MDAISGFKDLLRGTRIGTAMRGSAQDFAAVKSLCEYNLRAFMRGVVVPEGPELRTALRKKVAAKRTGLDARRMGELHLFVAYRLTDWEAVLPRALARFGRVTPFEWRGLGFDDSRPDWVQRRDRMNEVMLDAFNDAKRAAPVDAFVGYLSGHNTSPETLRTIGQTGAVIYNFCLDDKIGFPGPRVGGRYASPAALASAVDLNLTNAPKSLVKYAVHGGLAAFFPEAASPDIHHPTDVPFEMDVSFVGRCYGRRPQFIRALAKLGVSVECFGPGWPNGELTQQEMVALYSRSRINLGFSGIGYSRNVTCLKGRDFEVPMSGGLYLTEHNAELALVFDLGSEVVTYSDDHDCADKIKRLLADPARANRIRCAGRARALRDHTYEARWSTAFKLAGILAEDGVADQAPQS